VVFDVPGCVGHDALEEFGETDDFDFEACFFEDFAEDGLFDAFAGFDGSSRQAPIAF